MQEIAISKFKATCLAVLEKVRKTKEPVRITRFGKPIADITPAVQRPAPKRRLGALRGLVEIKGDIVSPISSDSDWEARME